MRLPVINVILFGFISVLALILCLAIQRDSHYLYIILICILLAVLIVTIKLPGNYKINVTIVITSTMLTLILSEIILGFSNNTATLFERHVLAAKNQGIPFDDRSTIEVIQQFRESGVEAYPAPITVNPNINVDRLLPLSGVSNATTILCNESGNYSIYLSDEHGFQNPHGIWGMDSINITFIGDSFTHGACVDPNKTASSLVRGVYPWTLNLGMSSSGPLDELAIIKEYVSKITPNVVIWLYFEGNDLDNLISKNLHGSSPHPITQYYQSDFDQDLISKQEELDTILSESFDNQLKTHRPLGFSNIKNALIDTLTLTLLRNKLLHISGHCNIYVDDVTFQNFANILLDAKESVSTWDGTLLFVYLPEWSRYSHSSDDCFVDTNGAYHDKVISIVNDIGLPTIDITEVFDDHPSPLSLFPLQIHGHYTDEGQAILATEILKLLSEQPPLFKTTP